MRPENVASHDKDARLIGGIGTIMLAITGLVFGGVLLVAYESKRPVLELTAAIGAPQVEQNVLIGNREDHSRQPVAPMPSTGSTHAEKFQLCGKRPVTCVVDGDTFWISRVKYRIADVDTPEVRSPRCPSEQDLGIEATFRLIELLNKGPFELRKIGSREHDRYGRTLRLVMRDGQSLGHQLVSEGLAHTWGGHKEPWCDVD